MEEAKAAAYYDELSRKGSGAARFKQGLGFSSSTAADGDPPRPGQGLPSASSFYSSFVRASGDPSDKPSEPTEYERRARLEVVKDKLRKKGRSPSPDLRKGRERDRDDERKRSGRRSRSRDRRRSNSRDRRRRSRSRERDGRDSRGGGRLSRSPRRGREERDKGAKLAVPDYARLIEGYSQMSSSERVKAKMKLQLKETAQKDAMKGSNTKWERFDFDKDAPLDDEEIDVAEDDVSLVKDIGRTFRFSAVQAKREDEIKIAHDLAMFGAPAALQCQQPKEPAADDDEIEKNENLVEATLISDNVVSAMRQGSWRDRVRRSR